MLTACKQTVGRTVPVLVALTLGATACGEETIETDEVTREAVVTTLSLERETTRGVSRGLNLDGIISGFGDPRGCRTADFTGPNGTEGVDNQLARILPLIDTAGENAVENLIQNAITEGRLLIYFQLESDADGGQRLGVRRGMDVPLLGTDGKLLEDQTLGLHPDPTLGTATNVTRDADEWMTERFPLRIPVVVFGLLYDLNLPEAFVRFRTGAEGAVTEGLIAGILPMADVLELLEVASENAPDFFEMFGDSIAELADVPYGAEECGAISVAIGFETTPVFTF